MDTRQAKATTPSISVIVCCYNAAATVGRTLETLRAQGFEDFEIVAIDDGSSDATVDVLHAAVQRDPRIRVLENSTNRGTAFTRQRGLEEARAELILFFDADDLADPGLLERLHTRLLADPDCMGVSCYAEYFDANGPLGIQRVGARDKDEFFTSWCRQKLYFQSIVTLTYRRLALDVGGFRLGPMIYTDSIRYEDFSEDLDLWCRMADLGAEGRYFVSIPEPLFSYRKPLESLSTKNLRLMQLKMRWIKDCLRRRREGTAERSLPAFIASRGLMDQFHDWRSDQAAAFYKKAGFAWSRRSWLGLGWYLGLTALASPKLIVQKLKTQAVHR